MALSSSFKSHGDFKRHGIDGNRIKNLINFQCHVWHLINLLASINANLTFISVELNSTKREIQKHENT